MAHDPNAFAEMVALTIKAALTPVLERVAGLAVEVKQALAVVESVTALRDRVVAIETKAAAPVVVPDAPEDLTPVLERVASLEAQIKQAMAVEPSVAALRDRVVVMETKAAALPAAPEPHEPLAPVLERLAGQDARLARLAAVELTVAELRDKLVMLEVKSAVPHEVPASGPSAADIELTVRDAVEPVKAALATMQHHVAVIEARPPLAGPPGKDGAPGLNGKDGADGLNGKDGQAGLKFEGVYQDGQAYDLGQLVTFGGSSWHCNEPTTTKPGESKAWTLMVKRGRDGKDGKDAEVLPVVGVGNSKAWIGQK